MTCALIGTISSATKPQMMIMLAVVLKEAWTHQPSPVSPRNTPTRQRNGSAALCVSTCALWITAGGVPADQSKYFVGPSPGERVGRGRDSRAGPEGLQERRLPSAERPSHGAQALLDEARQRRSGFATRWRASTVPPRASVPSPPQERRHAALTNENHRQWRLSERARRMPA
jgi:hypothetical protein